jgi:putative ABC transport system permease protein
LVLQSFADLRRQLDVVMNGVVGALWGLLATGFVVAAIAVANTLTMSIWEQTRELGMMRVVGLTQRQLRRLVAGESLLMGVAAAAAGACAGVTTAWIIHLCMKPLLGYSTPFSLDGRLAAVNVIGCLIVALLAAWAPGRRAARLNLLQAIAYE